MTIRNIPDVEVPTYKKAITQARKHGFPAKVYKVSWGWADNTHTHLKFNTYGDHWHEFVHAVTAELENLRAEERTS